MQGDVYPKGPWRPAGSAQRGSVQFLSTAPGDPLTPGKPALPGVPRLKMEEVKTLPRIPVQPISYGDARHLLEPLGGPVRPKGFQGGVAVSLSRRRNRTRSRALENGDGLSGAKD